MFFDNGEDESKTSEKQKEPLEVELQTIKDLIIEANRLVENI